MEQHNHFTQNSPEWYEARIGKFTSSEISRLLTEPKLKEDKEAGNLSQGAMTYVIEKVHETITNTYSDSYDSEATIWGVQNEPLARAWYEKINNVKVTEIGFTEISKDFGGSADGLVGEDGGIEIKCPYNGAIHLQHCLIDSREYFKKNFTDKFWQCVCNAFINDRKWWDFVSFDPRLNYSIGFFCFRIYPTQEEFDLISNKVARATREKYKLIDKLLANEDKA